MAHSLWYLIGQAVEGELQALASTLSVKLLPNPALPLDLGKQAKALFILQRGDKLLDKPGQRREKRQLRLVVGAAVADKAALAAADELHFAARDAMRTEALRAQLRALGDVSVISEVELEPDFKDMAVAGSVLLSAYEIDYFQQYPSAA